MRTSLWEYPLPVIFDEHDDPRDNMGRDSRKSTGRVAEGTADDYSTVNRECAKRRVQLDALARLATVESINDTRFMKNLAKSLRAKDHRIEGEVEEDLARILGLSKWTHAPQTSFEAAIAAIERDHMRALEHRARRQGRSVERMMRSRPEDYLSVNGSGIRLLSQGETVPISSLPDNKSFRGSKTKPVLNQKGLPMFVVHRTEISKDGSTTEAEVFSFFGIPIVKAKAHPVYQADIVDDRAMPIRSLDLALDYVLFKWDGDLHAGSRACSQGICIATDMVGKNGADSRAYRFITENAGNFLGAGGFPHWYSKAVREGFVPWFDAKKRPIPEPQLNLWMQFFNSEPESRALILRKLQAAGIEPNPGPPKGGEGKRGRKGDSKAHIQDQAFLVSLDKLGYDELLQLSFGTRPGKRREMIAEKLSGMMNAAIGKASQSGDQPEAATKKEAQKPEPEEKTLIKKPPESVTIGDTFSLYFDDSDRLLPSRHVVKSNDCLWYAFDDVKMILETQVVVQPYQSAPDTTDRRTAAEQVVDLKTYSQEAKVTVKVERWVHAGHGEFQPWARGVDWSLLWLMTRDLMKNAWFILNCVCMLILLIGHDAPERVRYSFYYGATFAFCLSVLGYLGWKFFPRYTGKTERDTYDFDTQSFTFNIALLREGWPRQAEISQASVNQAKSALSRVLHVNRLDTKPCDETANAAKVGFFMHCKSFQDAIDHPTAPLYFQQPAMKASHGS